MDERDRSRSPMAPVAQPVIVSNRNAEEMDGTERFETDSGREGERREARPGFGRRAEVGVIGQRERAGQAAGGGGGGDQEVPQNRAVRVPDDAHRQADDVTTYVHVHGPVNATTTGPMPVTAQGVRVTRRDWYEYTVARTSTVATLNAATAICRAITATVGAAVAAAGPPSQLTVPRTPVQPVQQLLRRAKDELARRAPPAATQTAGAALPALAKARIAASERLKAIAASFDNYTPTPTSIPAEARNEAIERVLSVVARLPDAMEREEALRMLERILTPGSLQQVRSLYDQLPAWEENRPPPAGWPFTWLRERASLQANSQQGADVANERERERERDANRTRRQVEANEAARDLFEDLFATQHHLLPGHVPRGPRMGNAVPSFEMVQIRDLPTMLTVQGMRVPPESRIEDRDEEQVVPTGPSIRSTHTVPLLNSQARLREGYEFEYRRRYGEMLQPVRPPPHPTAARTYDTPHPGVVVRATGEETDAAVPMSPLVQQQSRARPPVMHAMDAMVEIMRRQGRQGPQLGSGAPPMQHGVPSSSRGPPPTPSSAKPGVVGSTAGDQTSEGKIIVHKLRARTHRAPGQRREVSGLVGARRLIMEQKELDEKGGVDRVEAAPKPDNIRTWSAVVEGAEGSQYEGGVFFFDIDFPQSYPMVRAEGIKIKCLTHTVHPYIRVTGIVDAEAVAQLCFGVKFSEMNYGGVEKSLMIAAAVVSGKLPTATPEQTKQWIDRGRLFTSRYAC